ncbi:hypothetical protein [Streptomyces sp. cmx-18-6]|uniref:hypothetical protein n=1 Tax=Streptomyces sp. cmx-18-6 TaxID=2790930 RepID=UPI00397EE0A1
MALITAAIACLAFFWWYSLAGLFEGGTCGTRYGGPQCSAGTGWRIAVLVFLTPLLTLALSLCNNDVYGPERRGHELYRVVMLSVPLVALSQLLRGDSPGLWKVAGAALCVTAAGAVVLWTVRTIGIRGAFWLMRADRISAAGSDPASRSLSFPQNALFLAGNVVGALAGFGAAHATYGFLS